MQFILIALKDVKRASCYDPSHVSYCSGAVGSLGGVWGESHFVQTVRSISEASEPRNSPTVHKLPEHDGCSFVRYGHFRRSKTYEILQRPYKNPNNIQELKLYNTA